MSETLINEYLEDLNYLCNCINNFDFGLNNMLVKKIDKYDNFHNRLAAWVICEKLKKIYPDLIVRTSVRDENKIIVSRQLNIRKKYRNILKCLKIPFRVNLITSKGPII